jgi:hypothetical protein
MNFLSKNEIDQIGGGTMSINPCYKYIDCSYIGDDLAAGSSSLCPEAKAATDDAKYKLLDTVTEKFVTQYTYLANVCAS